jgi:uncharacterized repeat protein (TIGR03803 family)
MMRFSPKGPALGANLILDPAGNLYGSAGVIYELSPNSGGGWTETVLHTFTGLDGSGPSALIRDPAGNLYGTTYVGGAYDAGTIFMLQP